MNMEAPFDTCPSCREASLEFNANKELRCRLCGWRYYHNNAAAVAVIIRSGDRILFTVRNADPGKGLLDLPGGFVDPGESAEEAASRECREELGFVPEGLEYLGSRPNIYRFSGITYSTCDLFFSSSVSDSRHDTPHVADRQEVQALHWFSREHIPMDRVAFPSVRSMLLEWLAAAW